MAVQTQIQTRRGTAATWTSTNPTLAAGELGFETDTGKFKIGTGATAWTALSYAGGGSTSAFVNYQYTATAGQTTFSGADANGLTLAYTAGFEQVYVNGVLQVRVSDYTASNGTSVVLASAAILNDIVNVISYTSFAVADAIAKTTLTAKGALVSASAASTPAALAVGTNGQVLTADSTASTGLAWATPAVGGAKTWTLLSTTSMSGSSSINVTGISAKEDVLVLVVGATFSSTNNSVRFRINGDTGANYSVQQNSISPASTYADNAFNGFNSFGGTFIPLGTTSTNASSQSNASIVLSGCKSTGIKNIDYTAGATEGGGNDHTLNWGQGIYNGSAAVTNITVYSTATFNGGTIYVYGA